VSQQLRHPEILRLAREHGKVTVEYLAQQFDVTVQTVRRDLGELADIGKLERVHGGAVLPSGVTNIAYRERQAMQQDAKRAIARLCAQHIPDEASIFLNIGTSTEAVARELLHHRNILVVTNNMNVATTLSANPDCEVVLAGGQLRRADNGLVGALAVATIEQFRFDVAVIGCSALDPGGDILDFDIQEVSVSQSILRRSRKVCLVADHTKFSRSAPAKIGSLRDVDLFVTDAPLPVQTQQVCAKNGVQPLIVAQNVGSDAGID